MGSDPIALELLDWLGAGAGGHASLVGIFTGPDRPQGRGQSVKPNAVKAWSIGRSVPVHQPEKLDPSAREALGALKPDVVLVVAYGHILSDSVIAVPRLGTLNLHASILPGHRGASPIQTSVALGERETGMTLMRIVRELDAGPVADVERVPVGSCDTAADVEKALARACVPLVERSLPRLASGSCVFREQDHARATFCRRLSKADGVLDFAAPAAVLAARVNGLHPWPSVTVSLGDAQVRLGLADALEGQGGGLPGTVLGSDAMGLLVATGSGILRIRRMQRSGGRMLEAPEFLRGHPVGAGTLIPSLPMPALSSPTPFRR
jgi:methionyl-tRNA formyltransferase